MSNIPLVCLSVNLHTLGIVIIFMSCNKTETMWVSPGPDLDNGLGGSAQNIPVIPGG